MSGRKLFNQLLCSSVRVRSGAEALEPVELRPNDKLEEELSLALELALELELERELADDFSNIGDININFLLFM
jgi:hypothetical protein